MSDYDALVCELVEKFPHLVLEMTGPWRGRDGRMLPEPWICNFKNSSLGYRQVSSGSSGCSMSSALTAGLNYLKAHAQSTEVRNCDQGTVDETSVS